MKMISVLMGIFNCQDTLSGAVNSIIAQTYTNWELILCDDGSTDNTYAIAAELSRKEPTRIKLLQNTQNRGLNYTLNRCLNAATGEYIARMDGDDLCSPNRFAIQIKALEDEPNIAVVSSDMELFDHTGIWGRITHPEYPQAKDFLTGSPFCHAPCMMRRSALLAVGNYSESPRLLRVEDYHLWVKMYHAGYRGKNLHLPLYQMRDDRKARQRRKFRYRINEAYVRYLVVRDLKLPPWRIVHALRPILVGLLPPAIYTYLHKKRLS